MSQVSETNNVSLSASPKERSQNNTTCRLSYDCLISATKSFLHNFSNLTAEEKLEYKSLTNYVKQLVRCKDALTGARTAAPVKKVVAKKEEQSPTAQAAQAAAAAATTTTATASSSSSSSSGSSKKSKKGSSTTASTTPAVEVAATPAAPVETAPAQESKSKGKKSAPVKTK